MQSSRFIVPTFLEKLYSRDEIYYNGTLNYWNKHTLKLRDFLKTL